MGGQYPDSNIDYRAAAEESGQILRQSVGRAGAVQAGQRKLWSCRPRRLTTPGLRKSTIRKV